MKQLQINLTSLLLTDDTYRQCTAATLMQIALPKLYSKFSSDELFAFLISNDYSEGTLAIL